MTINFILNKNFILSKKQLLHYLQKTKYVNCSENKLECNVFPSLSLFLNIQLILTCMDIDLYSHYSLMNKTVNVIAVFQYIPADLEDYNKSNY